MEEISVVGVSLGFSDGRGYLRWMDAAASRRTALKIWFLDAKCDLGDRLLSCLRVRDA